MLIHNFRSQCRRFVYFNTSRQQDRIMLIRTVISVVVNFRSQQERIETFEQLSLAMSPLCFNNSRQQECIMLIVWW